MDSQPPLTRGGIYLARLDPARDAEVGKLRPVAILTAGEIGEILNRLGRLGRLGRLVGR